jgi:hypothetical protein
MVEGVINGAYDVIRLQSEVIKVVDDINRVEDEVSRFGDDVKRHQTKNKDKSDFFRLLTLEDMKHEDHLQDPLFKRFWKRLCGFCRKKTFKSKSVEQKGGFQDQANDLWN